MNIKTHGTSYPTKGVPVRSWHWLEDSTLKQIAVAAELPCVKQYVAVLPNESRDYGINDGSIIALKDYICPTFGGIDPGRGIAWMQTDIPASIFKEVFKDDHLVYDIKDIIPFIVQDNLENWDDFATYSSVTLEAYMQLARKSLGTLGKKGNIEIQEDEQGFICIMVCTGSRGLGHQINTYHTSIARSKGNKISGTVPLLDMETEEGINCYMDVQFALKYAKENRKRIIDRVYILIAEKLLNYNSNMNYEVRTRMDKCHNSILLQQIHNDVLYIHRKGAVQARKYEYSILSGSPKSHSWIVKTTERAHKALASCSAYAGEVKGLKRKIANEYKDIDWVIDQQQQLIKPVMKLKPLMVIQG